MNSKIESIFGLVHDRTNELFHHLNNGLMVLDLSGENNAPAWLSVAVYEPDTLSECFLYTY